MDPEAAAIAADYLGVAHVVPIHYGTFPILAGTPDRLRAALANRGRADIEVHAPERGETIRI
jgi:L-ascorbate metabolism protein UlaG (beta-lactamase superfamily)